MHTIQTNGTLIDDAWAAFFKGAQFLVGVSAWTDRQRSTTPIGSTRAAGRRFDRVMRGSGCSSRRRRVEPLTTITTPTRITASKSTASYATSWSPLHPVHPDRGAAVHPVASLPANGSPSARSDPGGVRPISDRGVRGVGPPRRRNRVRADVRHRAGVIWFGQPPALCVPGRRAGGAGPGAHRGPVLL